MGNPYTKDLCENDPDCGECINCRVRERHDAWSEGFNAGLEAAAKRCEVEHARLEGKKSADRFGRMLDEERSLVCAQLADEIRAMKGGEGE